MNTRMVFRIGSLLGVVALSFFALGQWMISQKEPSPLAWYAEYQASLWQPLQAHELTLGEVAEVLPEGSLWLISADGEPRLASRYSIASDGQQWHIQAVIELDQQQTASLVQAQGWLPNRPDQPVNPAIAESLAAHQIERISMIPDEPVELRYIEGTFGPVEVRLASVGEVLVYARQGVIVAVSDELATSIMFGVRDRI